MARFRSTLPLTAVNDLFLISGGPFTTPTVTDTEIKFTGFVDLAEVGPTALFTSLEGENLTQAQSGRSTLTGFVLSTPSSGVLELTDFRVETLAFIRALERGANERAFELVSRGADTFTGSEFGDLLRSYAGDDTVNAGDGDDNVRADGGNDRILGGAGNDTLFGGGGADFARGDDGNDRLIGAGGDDTLIGGDGDDEIRSGAGADSVLGGSGDDFIVAGGGDDIVRANQGADDIRGGGGDDTLFGGGGEDTINGGGGDDLIVGGGGRDTINGGAGEDTLSGGGGRDTFIFSRADGDQVRGFRVDKDDISLSRIAQITDFDDLLANHLRDGDNGAEIFSDAGLIVQLRDVDASALDADDFIF